MKKFKVFFLSLITTFLLLAFLWGNFASLSFSFITIFILYYLATYWILDFDINKIGLLTLLLFPSVMVSGVSTFLLVYTPKVSGMLNSLPSPEKGFFTVLVYFTVVTFISYSTIISMNIFNVSRYKRIPLLQAAQTIVYIYTVIGGYMILNLIHHFFFEQWYLIVGSYLLTSLFLFFMNAWSIKLSTKEIIGYTLLGGFIILQLMSVLIFFPLAPYIFAISVTAFIYIYNGIITHVNKRNLLQKITIEYASVAFILVLLILITSRWGIAGNFIGL